jgi:adenosylcobinamide-phosphate synthase
VLLALAADLTLGEPSNRWHPVAWIGRAIRWAQPRLMLGSRLRLRVAGAVLVVTLAGGAAALAWGLTEITSFLGAWGVVLEALVFKATFSIRRLARATLDVAAHLEHGDLAAARFAVSYHLVSRETATLDEGHVASAAIESVAENLADSVVAPLLFFVAFGLAGAVAYRVVNTADAMIGYREGALEDFGKASARLDDLLNLVPARCAAALLILVAMAGARSSGAFRTMWRDHASTASPNAGWTMAAMAGALGVRLEKKEAYCLGAGDLPGAADVRRGVTVFGAASGIAGLLSLAASAF